MFRHTAAPGLALRILATAAGLGVATPALSQTAVADLPPVANVESTRGPGLAQQAGLKFCTLADVAPLAAAAATQQQQGKRPVLTAWSIAETPGRIARVVAVSSVEHAACQPLRPLPAGGVARMDLHVPYAVIDKAPDWSTGFTALVMAVRDPALPAADYVPRLRRHVDLVTHLFESKGLDGYLVYAGEDHEWAYLHWPDEDTAKRAFATPDGATGPKDSRSIQRPIDRTPLATAAR